MSPGQLSLQIFHDSQQQQIEETAFRLLEEVGIRLQHDRAREMLHGHGCRVQGNRVLIPRQTVAWALANVDGNTAIRSADGSQEVILGSGQFLAHNGGSVPNFADTLTGQRRPARLQDLIDGTRVLDALPNVDIVIPLVGPQDLPDGLMTIAAFEAVLHHTSKPIGGGAVENPTEVRYLSELIFACCGGKEAYQKRPTIPIMASPVSPLTFTEKVTSSILAIVEAGITFYSLPAPTMGASGPITMAGALAQQQAEILASFVIAAAARPGAPVVYCSRINPIDMRTGLSWWGGPDMGMSGACAAQLAHRLGLKANVYGLCTSSAVYDPRYAFEKFANALMPALVGADVLSGVGTMESGLTATAVGSVIDSEMISLMHHILRSYDVNEETLAFDVMKEVILNEDIFLGQIHTVQHLRDGTVWYPELKDRPGRSEADLQAGVVSLAREKVLEILSKPEKERLPDAVCRDLEKIMQQARRELGRA